MYTIYDSYMMHGSWDMECKGANSLSFWTIFCTFIPLITQKIKILKNWNNIQEILSFYKCAPLMTIIWCKVPEIWSMKDTIFCHFGPFFALLPPIIPKKSKFWKNEKTTWRYYHFTHVYHKWQSYDVWFLR